MDFGKEVFLIVFLKKENNSLTIDEFFLEKMMKKIDRIKI